MKIRTTSQITYEDEAYAELDNSLIWQEFQKEKWVNVKDVIKVLEKYKTVNPELIIEDFKELVDKSEDKNSETN